MLVERGIQWSYAGSEEIIFSIRRGLRMKALRTFGLPRYLAAWSIAAQKLQGNSSRLG